MKARFLSLALVSLAVAGSPALAAAPNASCPAKTFSGFLAAFMDSSTVQRSHVAVPLLSISIDSNAQPEPAPVRKMLTAREITYPLMPGKAQRAKDRLKTTVKSVSAGETEVKLAQADTGYQLRYLFRKTANCWTLTRMSDDSL